MSDNQWISNLARFSNHPNLLSSNPNERTEHTFEYSGNAWQTTTQQQIIVLRLFSHHLPAIAR